MKKQEKLNAAVRGHVDDKSNNTRHINIVFVVDAFFFSSFHVASSKLVVHLVPDVADPPPAAAATGCWVTADAAGGCEAEVEEDTPDVESVAGLALVEEAVVVLLLLLLPPALIFLLEETETEGPPPP